MKQLVTLLLLTAALFAHAQSFEGTLVYTATHEIIISEKMKGLGLTAEKVIERMKAEGSYIDTIRGSYRQGNYRNDLNTTPRTWTIYRPEDNKLYTFQDGEAKDICTVTDMGVDLEQKLTGSKPRVTRLDTTAMVGDIPCELVRVQWKSGSYDYYYNKTKLMVNPALYAAHVYDGWAEYLAIAKALPLKIVKRAGKLSVSTITLVDQKPGPVTDGLFLLPTLVEDKALDMGMPHTKIMRIR